MCIVKCFRVELPVSLVASVKLKRLKKMYPNSAAASAAAVAASRHPVNSFFFSPLFFIASMEIYRFHSLFMYLNLFFKDLYSSPCNIYNYRFETLLF